MNETLPIRPIVLVGPTAGGKSELAVALAEDLHGEIINADSMQVYRHMEAGTAKPSLALQARAPHHLIDIVEPTERFTAADWLGRTEALLHTISGRGHRPIVVGGTNLYLRALLEGMFEGPAIDEAIRARLSAMSGGELHARLALIDPPSAQRIHPNDRKKLIRAIEVFEITGKPISEMQSQWESFGGTNSSASADHDDAQRVSRYRFNPILIGLDWPVEAINRRINARVKRMFFPEAPPDGSPREESLPDETRRLESAGLLGPQAREALGYKQVLEHLVDPRSVSLDDALERTKILTRRFAKTQRTWLRRYVGVHWLPAAELAPDELAPRAAAIVQSVNI